MKQEIRFLMIGGWITVPLECVSDTYDEMYEHITRWMADTAGEHGLLNLGGKQLRSQMCCGWYICPTPDYPDANEEREFRQLQIRALKAQISMAGKLRKDIDDGQEWKGDDV